MKIFLVTLVVIIEALNLGAYGALSEAEEGEAAAAEEGTSAAQQHLEALREEWRRQKIEIIKDIEEKWTREFPERLEQLESEAEKERFTQEVMVPFTEKTRAHYVDILGAMPPFALSKFVRLGEYLGKDPLEIVLEIGGKATFPFKQDIRQYQHWSAELRDMTRQAEELKSVPRSVARTEAGGRDVKNENRDQIIAHISRSRIGQDLAWMAYGNPHPEELSYAQKGALIKGYLTVTGRNPHDPTGETWDEAQYTKMRVAVSGLLSFQEVIGQMRACKEEEERVIRAGTWNEDFDC